jgi:uncharacterized protein YbjQ (UPF0145 family)
MSLLLVVSLVCLGCATATADPELRRAAASVELLEKSAVGDRQYTILGEIVGDSCARQVGSTPTVDEARERMRIEAGKLKADAVINFICEPVGVSMKRNCWKAIECRGDAIQWK